MIENVIAIAAVIFVLLLFLSLVYNLTWEEERDDNRVD